MIAGLLEPSDGRVLVGRQPASLGDSNTRKLAFVFQAPTLIIHPEKDEHLPLSHPEDYFQAVGSAIKEKVIVPGADHTFTSVAWEREVIDRTVAWFTTHLLKPLR